MQSLYNVFICWDIIFYKFKLTIFVLAFIQINQPICKFQQGQRSLFPSQLLTVLYSQISHLHQCIYFQIDIPRLTRHAILFVRWSFLDCFALSRYSFKTQIIRYIGYAYNTDLFVSRWLISKFLEINAANLELRRNGLVYAFSQMLTQF